MKTTRKIAAFVVAGLVMIGGCISSDQRVINPRVSLWYKDKIPYGTWFAYNSLEHLYGDSSYISVQSNSPEKAFLLNAYDWKEDEEADSSSLEETVPVPLDRELYIIVCPEFLPSEKETGKLLEHVSKGHHLVIASVFMNEAFLQKMQVGLEMNYIVGKGKDSSIYRQRSDAFHEYHEFGYPGFDLDQYFTLKDTAKWTILGETRSGKPNCIRIQKDSGTIILLANPLVLTNFFLLHKKNHILWTSLLSGLPSKFSVIWWDEYFRHADTDKKGFSSLGVLLKYPSLKWALYTTLLLMGLLLISEMKRRQKVIPVIPPPDNPSLDFVKTIGRLYYQAKDNEDLARKIESHFKDFVRQQYGISGNQPDTVFARQLSMKAGVEESVVKNLLYEFKMIEEHGTVPDEDLLRINELIEQFHKNRT